MKFFHHKTWRIGIFLVFLAVFPVVTAPTARAEYWGTNYLAAVWKNMIERMDRILEGVALGQAKMQAIQMLNSELNSLLGGVNGQALFIRDYEDFLIHRPRQETVIWMEDIFTATMRGKDSRANYVGVGDIKGLAGNYQARLIALGKSLTTEQGGIPQYDLDEYAPNPDVMFETGNWRAFNAFFTNPMNNSWGAGSYYQQEYLKKLAQNQQIAEIKAQASGFLPREENGQILLPSGSVEALATSVQTMGNTLIATAQDPYQFLSGVVTAYVNRTVNSLIQRGVSTVRSAVQNQVATVNSRINQTVNEATRSLGPAARVINSATPTINRALQQSTNVQIKLNTPAPPVAASDGPAPEE